MAHEYKVKKTYTENGTEYTITVTYGLEHIKGDRQPYFHIVGEIWRSKNGDNIGRNCITCGCLHEEIQRLIPEISELITFHLSDQDGTPMYYLENGRYWLENYYGVSKYPSNTPAEQAFRNTVRYPIGEMPSLANFDQWAVDRLPSIQQDFRDMLKKYQIEEIG